MIEDNGHPALRRILSESGKERRREGERGQQDAAEDASEHERPPFEAVSARWIDGATYRRMWRRCGDCRPGSGTCRSVPSRNSGREYTGPRDEGRLGPADRAERDIGGEWCRERVGRIV